MSDPPFLVLDRLDKRFGDHRVLDRVSLDVALGETLALLGPSGSGKTTLLRLLAGFETPDGGRVLVGGEELTALPPARRKLGMVFQHYALFPHLSVGENVAFGLSGRGLDPREVQDRVAEMLALVDLAGFEPRRVSEISGGQQQRVALARALAPEPRVLLLDEPLSNLDPTLRERTRRELARALARVGITTVLVTHEQEEAFTLGDRVAVLAAGSLLQVGTPEDLYARPATRFVATFVGRASVLPGRLVQLAGETAQVRLDDTGDPGGPAVVWEGVAADGELSAGAPVEVVVRPEALELAAAATPGSLPGRVLERRFTGPLTYYVAELASGRELELVGTRGAAAAGDLVHFAPRPDGPAPRVFAAGGEGSR